MNHVPHQSISLLSRLLVAITMLLTFANALRAQQPGTSPVKIFILAGQSNMEGQGEISPVTTQGTLEYIVANDPGGKYQFLSNGAGGWKQWDDVWIHYERNNTIFKGNLTAGYGSAATTVGPELGFGQVVGGTYDNQVLIIKAAWGGKSLAVDFRPPSSGGTRGFYYDEIVRLVNDAIANLGTYFPNYNAAGGYEIAGFGWHQGWNDRVTPAYSAEYETNMANFIRDIRTSLGVPGLPFVIATTGMDGGASSYSQVELAQLAMADAGENPSFVGNVAVVDTRISYDGMDFWQPVALSPANQDYHWNRNAKTYVNIGLAMGDAIATLTPGRSPSRLRATGGSVGLTLTWQNGTETPTSVRVLRNSVEIAAAAPVSPATFLDTGAEPGWLDYRLEFTMPGTPSDPLTVSYNGGITGLQVFRSPGGGVGLTWTNNLSYAGIEVRRDGTLLGAALSGTATSYTDASPPTGGLVTYTVVPTTGTAAPTAVQINLDGPPAGNALIYESFDYAVGGLDLKSSNSEVGLDGTWNANPTTLVVGNSLSYGTLPVGGGSIGNLTYFSNEFGGARAVKPAALAGNGLLANGATLWFSLVMGYGRDAAGNPANIYNARLCFALANSSFGTSGYQFWIKNEGITPVQLGSGLGVTLGAAGQTMATQFRDSSFGETGYVTPASFTGTLIGNDQSRLIVGKITWGAASDTIQLYQPDTNLNLGPVISTLTVNVDQSTYDTITFSRGDPVVMDEIRFGASYADVTGAGITADTTPPTLTSFVDNKSGGPILANQTVTYTVTFSEPMNASTVDITDFTNASATPITVNSVTATGNAAVFQVVATPNAVGTLRLQVKAGASLTDVAGNLMVAIPALDDTTITVNAPPNLAGQLGILDLSANGGVNPATGVAWAAGDQYRLAFVTSTTTQATSSDITTYNAFVQGLAAAAGLGGGTWKVIGSTLTVAARDNTGTNPGTDGVGVPVFLMDGTTLFANNNADLWNGAPVALKYNEYGAVVTTNVDRIFAGTEVNGTPQPSTQTLGGSPNVQTGRADTAGDGWIRDFNVPATASMRVYALSDPLTIVATGSSYANWSNGTFANGATLLDKDSAHDPDGDGLSNQQEFAFGLDPTTGASVNPITQQPDQTTGVFKYTRTKGSNLTYIYQSSTTLSEPWDVFTPVTDPPTAASISATVEEVTIEVPASLLGNSKLFLRVKAE